MKNNNNNNIDLKKEIKVTLQYQIIIVLITCFLWFVVDRGNIGYIISFVFFTVINLCVGIPRIIKGFIHDKRM